MTIHLASRPARGRCLSCLGSNANLRDPASARGSAASRPILRPDRRGKARGENRLLPEVEGMDARLLLAAGVHATAARIAARIAPVVQYWMERDRLAGMGVAVTYNGRVLLTKGYGMADIATAKPVTARTRFEVASMTKTFTAEALLLLVQKPRLIRVPGIGRLNLDAPISNYVKDRGGFHLPETWANLTTRQLLNMSHGIPDAELDPQIPWYDVINASAPNNLAFPPGTEYLYSNVSTWVVGETISQLTGLTYQQFVTRHLLRPLGMTHTTFIGPEPLLPGQATGYEYVSGQFVQPKTYASAGWSYASGSIVSTAHDMGRYLAGLQRREILSPAMYREMWTPTPLPMHGVSPTVIATPGLGWADDDSIHVDPRAGRVVTKSGGAYGYTAQASLFLDQGYGITVLCNTNSPPPHLVLPEEIVNAINAAIVGISRPR